MKITIETPMPGEEDEVIVRAAHLDERILNLIAALKNDSGQITGYLDDKIVKMEPHDIFYFESVDNKVFAYTKSDVFEVHKKLYEIIEEFEGSDFLRVSKSSIVNLSKVAYFRPIFNGRFEAKLKNDEKIIVSRQYVADIKQKLGI